MLLSYTVQARLTMQQSLVEAILPRRRALASLAWNPISGFTLRSFSWH